MLTFTCHRLFFMHTRIALQTFITMTIFFLSLHSPIVIRFNYLTNISKDLCQRLVTFLLYNLHEIVISKEPDYVAVNHHYHYLSFFAFLLFFLVTYWGNKDFTYSFCRLLHIIISLFDRIKFFITSTQYQNHLALWEIMNSHSWPLKLNK